MMKISVAIPVRNEANNVAQLIQRLLGQTRPPDEIVITDGGSTDKTAEIITEFINNGAPVRLIRAGEALPGRGRNLAAAAATNDWIAFIDAGIEPAKDWLELLSSTVENDSSVDVVYGEVEPIIDSFFAECAAITYVQRADITRHGFIASSLMRRSVWKSVGGFSENLRSAEDLLFMMRIEREAFNYVREPRAVVHWHLQRTFTATIKRFVVYARNNMRAGLWRRWQGPVFSRYLMLVALAVVILVVSPNLIWLPVVLWLLMLLARAIVAIRRNGARYPAGAGRNLKRLVIVLPLLATLDVAAFIGSIQWLFVDWFRGQRTTAAEAGDGA
jgi:glycosyltransferase involved in cell wall biosynthesis